MAYCIKSVYNCIIMGNNVSNCKMITCDFQFLLFKPKINSMQILSHSIPPLGTLQSTMKGILERLFPSGVGIYNQCVSQTYSGDVCRICG